jgi:membrane fusion protein
VSQGLFRKEVLESRRTSWLGAISLAQPLNAWLLSGVAGIVAIAVVLFLCIGTYTRRSGVAGQLVPTRGLATMASPASGVIDRLDVAEGDFVTAGQMLGQISVPRATLAAGDTTAALQQRLQQRQVGLKSGRSAQLRQFDAQATGLRTQLATARRELVQLQAGVDARLRQVEIYRQNIERLQQLQKDKFVSVLDVNQYRATELEYASEMEVWKRQAVSTERQIDQLQQALRELPWQRQATEATYQREIAQLEQERLEVEANGALVVNAPVAGIVATQTVKVGQAVQAGQALLSLLPADSQLQAELLVPSRAIGFVEPGNKVQLRYQAYPYQKFGHHDGRVERISRSALSSGELGALIGDASQGEPFYQVTVALARQNVMAYGKQELLKPGMLLDADILGEKRRLIEWVFEPLYSVRGKVSVD